MSDKDLIRLDSQLCFMLYACSRAMTKAYQPMLKDMDITYPQYIVLMVLWEWEDDKPKESSVKALGERLQLDSGTLTPLLKRLELAGLVTRERDEKDERRVLIGVTKKGSKLQFKTLKWMQKLHAEKEVDNIAVEQLRNGLKQLLASIS